jgi:hypothetical protein
MKKKKPNCIIEQYATGPTCKGFNIDHNPETFKPFWDTVAITKVYLRPEYLEQLHQEQQNSMY